MASNSTSHGDQGSAPEEPFGAALLRCFRAEGLPLLALPYATIQKLKAADRGETLAILRSHSTGGISYALIQQIKRDTPERIAERLATQYALAAQQATMAMLFMM